MQPPVAPADPAGAGAWADEARPAGTLVIALPVARLGTMLLLVPVGLMLVSLAYRAWAASGGGAVLPPERFFDSVGEDNPATWYASLQLLGAAVVSWLAALTPRARATRASLGWVMLGCGFALFSLDEVARLHEHLATTFSQAVAGGTPDPRAQMMGRIAFIPVALLSVVPFLPWLRFVPRPLAWRLVLAGGVYLQGALGLEFLPQVLRLGLDPTMPQWATILMNHGEELLELLGIALYIRFVATAMLGPVAAVELCTSPAPRRA